MNNYFYFWKETLASPNNLEDCITFLIIKGLKTLSSKCPLEPPTLTATLFPIT